MRGQVGRVWWAPRRGVQVQAGRQTSGRKLNSSDMLGRAGATIIVLTCGSEGVAGRGRSLLVAVDAHARVLLGWDK
jgi:hypothetical protein